jgi:hypothetical protein
LLATLEHLLASVRARGGTLGSSELTEALTSAQTQVDSLKRLRDRLRTAATLPGDGQRDAAEQLSKVEASLERATRIRDALQRYASAHGG